MSQFEGPVGGITGVIDAKPLDPASPGTTPYIIQVRDPFEIQVDWAVDGGSAPYLGGMWHLRLYISPSDGKASTKGELGSEDIPVSAAPSLPAPRPYQHVFKISPYTVAPGVYQLTVVLTYDNGGPALEMAAFTEIPFMEFYDA